jgi:subtilisin-like proprotein convertase family protein
MSTPRTVLHVLMATAFLLAGLAPGAGPASAQPAAVSAALPVAPAAPAVAPDAPPGCLSGSGGLTRNPGLRIPAAGTSGIITDTMTLNGLFPYIWDVNVTTVITHTWNNDLNIQLISPAGTAVTLTSNNGYEHDHVFNGTVWDDQAAVPVTRYQFINNQAAPALVPEEALGAFIGENPNGVWKLVINDTAGGDFGGLVSWSLEVTSLAIAPFTRQFINNSSASAPIGDQGIITRTLSFSNRPGTALGRLSLFTNITHTQSSDLRIRLISPTGLATTIVHQLQGAGAGVFAGTQWIDKAGSLNPPGPITDLALPAPGAPISVAVPEGAMAAFNGHPADGPWRLEIRDAVGNGHTGTLLNWELAADIFTCMPLLQLEATGYDQPSYPVTAHPYTYTLKATNTGYTATSVVLSHTLPAGATLLSLQAPGATCSQPLIGQHGSIACTYPGMASLASHTYTVSILTPQVPQIITGPVSAASEPPGLVTNAPIEVSDTTSIRSANGNVWDVLDKLAHSCASPCDTGAVGDGGQDAFDDWGALRLLVLDGGGSTVDGPSDDLFGFDLTYSLERKWQTAAPVAYGGLAVSRALYAPTGTDYLRYVDTFTNTSGAARQVWVAWGGNLGSDGGTTLARTSSGDLLLATADTWAVTIENDDHNPDGMAGDPPVGYGLRNGADTTYQGPVIFGSNPITTTWPVTNNEYLAHLYRLDLAPGQSASLAYFLYLGMAEDEPGPQDCETLSYPCTTPAPGSQANLAAATLAALAAQPDLCDLSQAERANIRNWPGAGGLTCASKLYLPLVRR